MPFDDRQMLRYARHIVLPEVGGTGQAKLLEASVLVIGAGGLGSPLLLYLAAAGIGRLGIVDDDAVDLSNLHRQIAHPTAHVGLAKTTSAKRAIAALNPDIDVTLHEERLTADNAAKLIRDYDLVADGSDNFATRDAVHGTSFSLKKPLVSAAVQGVEGQLSTYKAYLGPPHPCYRCVFPRCRRRISFLPARKGACSAPSSASWDHCRRSRWSRNCWDEAMASPARFSFMMVSRRRSTGSRSRGGQAARFAATAATRDEGARITRHRHLKLKAIRLSRFLDIFYDFFIIWFYAGSACAGGCSELGKRSVRVLSLSGSGPTLRYMTMTQ